MRPVNVRFLLRQAGPRFRYVPRSLEADAELQYNQARSFDPTLGRWLSSEPLGLDKGEENLFRYPNPPSPKDG